MFHLSRPYRTPGTRRVGFRQSPSADNSSVGINRCCPTQTSCLRRDPPSFSLLTIPKAFSFSHAHLNCPQTLGYHHLGDAGNLRSFMTTQPGRLSSFNKELTRTGQRDIQHTRWTSVTQQDHSVGWNIKLTVVLGRNNLFQWWPLSSASKALAVCLHILGCQHPVSNRPPATHTPSPFVHA